jgi:hypothetical protein
MPARGGRRPESVRDVESAASFITRRSAAWRDKPKKVRVKDIGRRGFRIWVREAWTFMPQSGIPEEKILVVELWRYRGQRGRGGAPPRLEAGGLLLEDLADEIVAHLEHAVVDRPVTVVERPAPGSPLVVQQGLPVDPFPTAPSQHAS